MSLELIVALVVPGWSMRHRRLPLAIVVFTLGVVALVAFAVYTVVSGRNWVAMSLDTSYLAWMIAVMLAALVARLIAVGELWNEAGRPTQPTGTDWAAIACVSAVSLLALGGIVQVGRARSSIAPAFAVGPENVLFDAVSDDQPLPTLPDDAPTDSVVPLADDEADDAVAGADAGGAVGADDAVPDVVAPVDPDPPPLPERPRSGIEPEALEDVTTILLVGGDAGPGRYGLRTDTMMLFSLHEPSGRASLVSLPRNMRGLLFPPGSALEERFPYGFTRLANSVYPYVSASASLREAYRVDGVDPGIVALAHAIGYSLDVTIDDYVMVNMQGFLELIDAIGGVTVYVPTQIPMPGNVPGAKYQYPETIGPGTIDMDGTLALGYVRSRKGDNDYYRAGRQRALLAALATQIAPEDVLLSFESVVAALGTALRTSLSPDELAETLTVIGGDTAIVESVGLVPPLVSVTDPDFQFLAEVVGEVRLALATGQPSGW